MVALAPRFTLLATALSSVAFLSAVPAPAGAAVIKVNDPSTSHPLSARHSAHEASAVSHHPTTSHDDDAEGKHSSSHVNEGKKKERMHVPTVPLPAALDKQSKKALKKTRVKDEGHHSGKQKHMKVARDAWDVDPISRMRNLWMGSQGVSMRNVLSKGSDPRPGPSINRRYDERVTRRHHEHRPDRVIVDGHDNHITVNNEDHGRDHGKTIVFDGDHAHVHLGSHSRRSLAASHHKSIRSHTFHSHAIRSPHSHDHDHDRDHDHDHDHDHHGHHYHDDEKVVVKGDDNDVNVRQRNHRRAPSTSHYPILISGNHGDSYAVQHDHAYLRAESGERVLARRDDTMVGVPGTVDIVSQNGSGPGERIASLALASAGNGTSSWNDTASGNDTSTGGSSSAAFVLTASNSDRTQMYLVQAPDGSSSMPNSTAGNATTSDSFLKVLLQTPVFDAESAQLKTYCATYDPRPLSPAQMTMESCTDGSATDEHKSQVFAYEPDTGFVRPVWSEDEETGDTSADDTADDPPDSDANLDDPSGTPSGDSDLSPSAGANSTSTDVSALDDDVSGVTSFDQEALDAEYGKSTLPPMRFAHSFAAEGARNVTLMFTPIAPEVFSHSPAEKVAQPSDSAASGGNPTTAISTPWSITTDSQDTASTTMTMSSQGAMNLAQTAVTSSTSTSSDASPTSFDQATYSSSSSSTTMMTASALEVKVYNPYATDVASDSSTSAISISSSAVATDSTSSASSSMATLSSFKSWIVKERAFSDLD